MKKVLIITYYWPPAGGPGVQRVLKFAKYLPEFGWQPIVLTVANGNYPAIDESLVNDIPAECKIYKTNIFEPHLLYKKFTGKKSTYNIPTGVLNKTEHETFREKFSKWIRLNLFIPDARIGWLPSALRMGKTIIEQENIDIVFTSSPPASVHLIAKKLSQKYGLKWITDFRDPWLELSSYQDRPRSAVTKYIDGKLEAKVLNNADTVVSISPEIINLFKQKVGEKNFKIIYNGFDKEDFKDLVQKKSDIFTITYTGFLSNRRLPKPLIPALKKLKDKKIDFRLQMIGRTCNEFKDIVEQNNLLDKTIFTEYVQHKKALGYLINSDVLLLVIDDLPNNTGFLTGKIFDYFGCRKPIFAIGPTNGDANKLIMETNSGKMVDYNDFDGAYQLILEMYKDWKVCKNKFKFIVDKFERKEQARQLVHTFEEMA
jgi:glycosyltransferase involved in cell wall biosynthesis